MNEKEEEKEEKAEHSPEDVLPEGIDEITEEVFDDTCRLKLREMSKGVEYLVQQMKAYNDVYMQSLEDRKKHVLQYLSSDKGIFYKRLSRKYVGFITE